MLFTIYSYEEYLDSQISGKDMFYLEDVELARQLVELGYRGSGEVLSREEFEKRKEAAEIAKMEFNSHKPQVLVSAGKDLDHSPLLKALAVREEAVLNGKLSTIIFIRDTNSKGQEVSGYIDFGHRLRSDNLEPIFSGKKRLMPKASDLSYYNWKTKMSSYNHTPNFLVIADAEHGLLFKNKRDRKVINVDPRAPPGDNSTRVEIVSSDYVQVVLYDHIARRRG